MEHLNKVDEQAGSDLTPMPELQHNLRLLVDMAEADIQTIDAKLRHEKDTAVRLLSKCLAFGLDLGSD